MASARRLRERSPPVQVLPGGFGKKVLAGDRFRPGRLLTERLRAGKDSSRKASYKKRIQPEKEFNQKGSQPRKGLRRDRSPPGMGLRPKLVLPRTWMSARSWFSAGRTTSGQPDYYMISACNWPIHSWMTDPILSTSAGIPSTCVFAFALASTVRISCRMDLIPIESTVDFSL